MNEIFGSSFRYFYGKGSYMQLKRNNDEQCDIYFPQNNVIDVCTKDLYNKYWQKSNFVLGVISIIALMYETLVVRIFIVRECECCLMKWMKTLPTKMCITSLFRNNVFLLMISFTQDKIILLCYNRYYLPHFLNHRIKI